MTNNETTGYCPAHLSGAELVLYIVPFQKRHRGAIARHDRRSIHVRLTEKGIKLRDRLTGMHWRHAEMLSRTAVSADDLQAAGVTLRRLERFWIRAADLVQQPPRVAVSSPPAQPLFA